MFSVLMQTSPQQTECIFLCSDMVMFLREKHDCLEQEVLQHRQEVSSLQEKLDSVTKVKFPVLGFNFLRKEKLGPDIQLIRICFSFSIRSLI